MFDIGFSELLLVLVIGLIILGPQRLPIAVKIVASWLQALYSFANTVQKELNQSLKLSETLDSSGDAKNFSADSLSTELRTSVDRLRRTTELMNMSHNSEYLEDPVSDLERREDISLAEEIHYSIKPQKKKDTSKDTHPPTNKIDLESDSSIPHVQSSIKR